MGQSVHDLQRALNGLLRLKRMQVGQTGQTVQSQVYLACGISGQIQHLVGMQSCDCIIAIDKNPDTPLMKLADITVVGDLFEVLPELIRQVSIT